MSWLVTPNELTPDQQRAIALNPDENRAIIGGPGSGKTIILLYRAQHLLTKYNVPNNRIMIFVYTKALKNYIRSAFDLLKLPEECAVTFDQWCRTFYEKYIGRAPWDPVNNMPDFAAIRSGVDKFIDLGRIKFPLYDFVMVDEAQDLPLSAISILRKIAGHLTICLDDKQQIYDEGSNISDILSQIGINRANIILVEAFRVCPYLVELSSEFISDPDERVAFKAQTRMPQVEKESPVLYVAKDMNDERRMLSDMVRERLLKNDRIAILFRFKKQVYGFASCLKENGIDVEVPDKWGGKEFKTHNFSSSLPKMMTYYGAKGLTFDSIFLPRLVKRSFDPLHEDRIEKLLFVGLTRATKWAYMSTLANNSFAPLLRLKKLKGGNTISIIHENGYLPPRREEPNGLNFL
jgi:superfamily I DNA/RNA helicase